MQFLCEKALVVAAHPDDEVLGCGGTMARLSAAGAKVFVLILGEGPVSRNSEAEKADAENNRHIHARSVRSALAASRPLGVEQTFALNYPDQKFDTLPLLEIVKQIEAIKSEIDPDFVFTHHGGDLNLDHRITNEAALTAFRPLPNSRPAAIFSFEVLSSTEYAYPAVFPKFIPNLYVDIDKYLDLKLKALEAYGEEMRPWPHPRSFDGIKALAHYRGCQCGAHAAEAFTLLRGVFL